MKTGCLLRVSAARRCVCVSGGGLCVCTAPPLFLLSLAAPVGLSLALLRVSSRAARKTQMESSAALTAVLDATLTALSRRGDLRALNGEKRELKNFKLRVRAPDDDGLRFFCWRCIPCSLSALCFARASCRRCSCPRGETQSQWRVAIRLFLDSGVFCFCSLSTGLGPWWPAVRNSARLLVETSRLEEKRR